LFREPCFQVQSVARPFPECFPESEWMETFLGLKVLESFRASVM
jgi:hypothetical protein